MTKQQEPIVIEIPLEEEADPAAKAETKTPNISQELQNLGRQFAATLEAAWNSQERQRMEQELREGLNYFSDEVSKVATDVSTSPAAKKVKEEASEIKGKVETSDLGRKSRTIFAQSLARLSDELSKLSVRLTPAEDDKDDEIHVEIKEKSPEDIGQ
jgi:protein subunit release factor A